MQISNIHLIPLKLAYHLTHTNGEVCWMLYEKLLAKGINPFGFWESYHAPQFDNIEAFRGWYNDNILTAYFNNPFYNGVCNA